MKYVAVKFKMSQARTYTYHIEEDDETVYFEGDEVKVPSPHDGWVRATIVQVDVPKPSFQTKRIMGKLEENDA